MRRLALGVLLTIGCVSGCRDDAAPSGGGESTSTTVIEATLDDAGLVADAVVANRDHKNAAFVATLPYGVASFTLRGTVDWEHQGLSASVEPVVNGVAQQSFKIWVNSTSLLAERPGLAEAMVKLNQPAACCSIATLNPEKVPLHQLVSLIGIFATSERENPVLLKQDGLMRLPDTEMNGATLQVFRLKRITYAIDPTTRLLYRATTDLVNTGTTATIEFSQHGAAPPLAEAPPDEQIVDEAAANSVLSGTTTTTQ